MIPKCIRDLIISKRKDGCTYESIATNLNITKSTVQLILTRKLSTNKKKTGPKNKIQKKDRLAIKRYIARSNSESKKVTSPSIIANCNLNTSVSTVQREVKKMEYKYQKSKQSIVLSKSHKEIRMKMVSQWITQNIDFQNVVFSDEKRFNLDGPDNWMTYLPKFSKLHRQKRQCKGGGIMMWGMVFSSGTVYLKKITGSQNSETYEDLISTYAVPHILNELGDNYIFQQDNCSIHVSKKMQNFFRDHNISILEWPSRSPDLNVMETIWKMLSDFVYDGPIFKNLMNLEEKIEEGLAYLNTEKTDVLSGLFNGYRNRMCDVLKAQGNMTKY